MHSAGQCNGAQQHTKHRTVWCALPNTVHAVECATRMLDMEALAEEVMFNAALWHNGGLSNANFFIRFEHLMSILAHGYSF